MSKEQKNINLLRRWISGEITAGEERDLETAANQDEVLRDAWSGYQAHAGADHEAGLAKLRKRLAKQQQKPIRRLLQPWMRIAAAIALLLVAGWVVFQTQGVGEDALATNQAEAPAEAKKDTPTDDSAKITFEAETIVESLSADATPATRTEPLNSAVNTELQPANAGPETAPLDENKESAGSTYETTTGGTTEPTTSALAENDQTALQADDGAAEETVVLDSRPVAQDDIVTAAPPPPPSAVSPDVYRTHNQAAAPPRLNDRDATLNTGRRVPNVGYRVITGYVTDEEGNPLIGASILEEGSANGTVADIDGYYELTVSNQSETLVVNYTGYETSNVLIGEEAEIRIALKEEHQLLDEVVVTGLGTRYNQQDIEADIDEVIGDAKPLDGFSEFRKYLRANASESAGRANVKVRFYVQADGRPSNVSIVSSTNPSLNRETIQLIEEGPAWTITSGLAPVEVTYTVKFR